MSGDSHTSWGLRSAEVRFGRQIALSDLTFEARRSAFTVIVGGDSAGKSTALRALVGLVRLDRGRCSRPAKEAIGYVPASGGIYADLTVAENLAFSGQAYGLGAQVIAERSRLVLDRVGLASASHRLGGHLSGGMQRKLAVAVALLHAPSLLVLDEPTTGVDPVSRSELWRLMAAEAASGTAVVVSTTYLREAQRAGTVVLLEQGRALVVGSPEQVIHSVPGAVGVVQQGRRPPGESWRWGRSWRVWAPDGVLPPGARRIEPGFDDAVIVSELAATPP
jgi:ABC-2 type transport system ATP-binding protein